MTKTLFLFFCLTFVSHAEIMEDYDWLEISKADFLTVEQQEDIILNSAVTLENEVETFQDSGCQSWVMTTPLDEFQPHLSTVTWTDNRTDILSLEVLASVRMKCIENDDYDEMSMGCTFTFMPNTHSGRLELVGIDECYGDI